MWSVTARESTDHVYDPGFILVLPKTAGRPGYRLDLSQRQGKAQGIEGAAALPRLAIAIVENQCLCLRCASVFLSVSVSVSVRTTKLLRVAVRDVLQCSCCRYCCCSNCCYCRYCHCNAFAKSFVP